MDLESAVRTYRIRSEVAREQVREGDRRRTVGLEVRLWATLPPGDRHLPDSPECSAAVLAALTVAEAVAARQDHPLGDIEPFHRALYDSRHYPGCDEIYVAIRLPVPYGTEGADQGREGVLVELKRRLETVGVHEGRWRPRPEQPAADAWQVRPAAQAIGPAGSDPRPAPPLGAPEPVTS